MKKAFLTVLGMVLILALSSCASGTKFTEVNPSLTSPNKEMGRIFFYRTAGVRMGGAVPPTIKLNGEAIGRANPKGFFYVDRPPGNYTAVTTTEVTRKVSFTLDKGETRFIRFNVSMGVFFAHVAGKLVDKEEGMREIQNCIFIKEDALLQDDPPAS